MRLSPPVLLACLALAAPASAAVDPAQVEVPLACFNSASGDFAITGYVFLEAGGTYRFDPDFPEDTVAGAWDTESGAFSGGALDGALIRDAAPGTTMPADQVAGRTWPLVVERGGAVSDYCRTTRVFPRELLAGAETYVERVSGVPVALPFALEQTSLYEDLDGAPYSAAYGRVRAAGRNFWRLDVVAGPCAGKGCPNLAIFSARRAPRRAIEVKFNRRLARGARGWQGNVGCAFGSGIGWGPVYCGQTVIVWRYRGVNYCIESRTADDAALVGLANQSIRSLPRRDIA